MSASEYLNHCPRCGVAATGRFCNQCGASLDAAEGTLRGEIESNFTSPVKTFLSFLKAAWLLLRKPTEFCRAWLNGPQGMTELSFPLAKSWKKFSSRELSITRPYKSLAIGIALVAA